MFQNYHFGRMSSAKSSNQKENKFSCVSVRYSLLHLYIIYLFISDVYCIRYIPIDNGRLKLLFLHESGITEESKARRCMDSMKWAALLTTLNISSYLKLTLNVSKVWLQAQQ